MTKHFPARPGSGDAKLSLADLNKRTAVDPKFSVPSQADPISSADDKPPSRQEFVALTARVVALEEAAKPKAKAAPKAGKAARKK
jgi:hypothetical protein